MRKLLLSALLIIGAGLVRAQFAPQAGIAGSTAIAKTSSLISAWATGCHMQRGLQQIGNVASGYASLGDSLAALGAPNGDVVSLGDSGIAVLTFAHPITDGPGPDFAVFENGFLNTTNGEEAFLELAFVEVSSDGVHYVRFPARSNTQDTVQLSPGTQPSYTNARQLNNLAGKYIGGWGTPFDLSELAGTPGLDVLAITQVRIVDVIGSIGAHASLDASGHKINDPFPSPFPSSGFDLDALGVINMAPTGIGNYQSLAGINIYPMPAGDRVEVTLPYKAARLSLFDATGRRLQCVSTESGHTTFNLQGLPAGSYFITIQSPAGTTCSAAFLHY
jgi:hypothetical protein